MSMFHATMCFIYNVFETYESRRLRSVSCSSTSMVQQMQPFFNSTKPERNSAGISRSCITPQQRIVVSTAQIARQNCAAHLAINVHAADFIHKHRNAQTVCISKQCVDQRRFSRPKKACDHKVCETHVTFMVLTVHTCD